MTLGWEGRKRFLRLFASTWCVFVHDNLFLCILAAGRYFDEISQDTGKYCFGVEDTLKALEMGAVEILIVYENLDIMRYVLHCQGTEGRWCFS